MDPLGPVRAVLRQGKSSAGAGNEWGLSRVHIMGDTRRVRSRKACIPENRCEMSPASAGQSIGEPHMPQILRFARLMQGTRGMSPKVLMSFLLHLPSTLRLVARLLKDARVPARLKLYCGLAAAYLIFPLDIVPDLLAPVFGLGFVDDITLVVLAFTKLIKDAPVHVVDEHVKAIGGKANPASWSEERP